MEQNGQVTGVAGVPGEGATGSAVQMCLPSGPEKLTQDGDTDDDASTAGADVLAETFHLAHYKVAPATGAGQMFGAHRS